MTLSLNPIAPQSLNIVTNERDLLRDLFVYLNYFRDRSVKRMTRTNEIPRGDIVKIAKLLGIDPPEKEEWEYAQPTWISFIDGLAYNMGLVSYDVQGVYRGESSQEPSFIENYVVINAARLDKFLERSPVQQEKDILEALNLSQPSSWHERGIFNEFFQYGPLGALDHFETWGAGTGIMPTLNFKDIRAFLLNVLLAAPVGQWFSTQSLIAYLKAHHPFFLIPEKLPKVDRRQNPIGRYDNFYENKASGQRDKSIPPDEPDAFERVEGRYVERFLEYIPLIMRFVDVAYDTSIYGGALPTRGLLKAFRVHERLGRVMGNADSQPKVTVQPNFDVIIESYFYPSATIQQIGTLGDLVSNPSSGHGAYVGIFQLKKAAVAAAMVRQPSLDVPALLKKLSGRDLPANVQIELDEWAGHADQFTLYEGFTLLETATLPPDITPLRVESITPTLTLIRNPEKAFASLDTLGYVPMRIRHSEDDFALLPEAVTSVFPRELAWSDTPEPARAVKISRVVTVSYQFSDPAALDAVQKMLAELRCPFHSDPKAGILHIQQTNQAKFDQALAQLASVFTFAID
jgi:hypothetical protein